MSDASFPKGCLRLIGVDHLAWPHLPVPLQLSGLNNTFLALILAQSSAGQAIINAEDGLTGYKLRRKERETDTQKKQIPLQLQTVSTYT